MVKQWSKSDQIALPPHTQVAKSRNRELQELFQCGFGMHHAGMLRADRTLVERLFSEGLIKVWGLGLRV